MSLPEFRMFNHLFRTITIAYVQSHLCAFTMKLMDKTLSKIACVSNNFWLKLELAVQKVMHFFLQLQQCSTVDTIFSAFKVLKSIKLI